MAIVIHPQTVIGTTFEGARDISTGFMVYYRALQVVWLEGLDAGVGVKAIEQARRALEASFTPTQLENPDMPGGAGIQMIPHHVKVELWPCGTQAWVYVTWMNPTFRNSPVTNQNLQSTLSTGIISVPWIQKGVNSDGSTIAFTGTRPSGTWFNGMKDPTTLTDEEDAPVQYYRQVPVVSIDVPFLRSSSPMSSVAGLQNMVNSGAVTWSGFAFPPRTLRFDGLTVSKFSGNGVDTFKGEYRFTARPDAWDEQDAKFGASGPWATFLIQQHLSASFAGSFPA